MKRAIDPSEWDFSPVPDNGLEYCCKYEYAREAEPQRFAVAEEERVLRLKAAVARCPWPAELQQQMAELKKKQFARSKNPLPLFQFTEGACDRAEIREYVHPRPWLKLTQAERLTVENIIKMGEESRSSPSAISLLSPHDLVSSITSNRLIKVTPDLSICAGLLGQVAVGASIDLEHFTDAEILAEFALWLTKIRGHLAEKYSDSFAAPEKKGKRLEIWRAQLDNLGIMRLRHGASVSEISEIIFGTDLKAVFHGCRSNSDRINRVNDRRTRVAQWFRDKFPELGRAAVPCSWELFWGD